MTLAPGETTTMQFDMANVAHNWQYFVKTYFYSEGEQKLLANGTPFFLVIFPKILPGDVTGDGILNVADMTALVDIILGEGTTDYDLKVADVDKDEKINVADVTALVDLILGKTE